MMRLVINTIYLRQLRWPRWRLSGLSTLALLVGVLVALPVAAVISHVLAAGTSDTWSHLSATVLPDYIWSTIWLCLGVGVGTALMGVGAAWLVTRYDFPLRGVMEWALVDRDRQFLHDRLAGTQIVLTTGVLPTTTSMPLPAEK